MDININHRVTIESDLSQAAKEWVMSVQGDKIKAMIDAAATRVQNDIASLKSQIANGQNNGLTDAEMAELQTKLDQIDPTTPTVLPDPQTAPVAT